LRGHRRGSLRVGLTIVAPGSTLLNARSIPMLPCNIGPDLPQPSSGTLRRPASAACAARKPSQKV